MIDDDELLTINQVRKIIKISRQTLWTWNKKGILKTVLLPSGEPRYTGRSINAITKGEVDHD